MLSQVMVPVRVTCSRIDASFCFRPVSDEKCSAFSDSAVTVNDGQLPS